MLQFFVSFAGHINYCYNSLPSWQVLIEFAFNVQINLLLLVWNKQNVTGVQIKCCRLQWFLTVLNREIKNEDGNITHKETEEFPNFGAGLSSLEYSNAGRPYRLVISSL